MKSIPELCNNLKYPDFLQERIDANDFPSAVYLVAEKGEIVFQDASGFAVVEPERIEAKADTIYDLASLTKVLGDRIIGANLLENEFEFSVDRYRLPNFFPIFESTK